MRSFRIALSPLAALAVAGLLSARPASTNALGADGEVDSTIVGETLVDTSEALNFTNKSASDEDDFNEFLKKIKDPNSCTSSGYRGTKLLIHQFQFHTSPTHVSSFGHMRAMGSVKFQIENPFADYIVYCSALSLRPDAFFYGDEVFRCENPCTKCRTSFSFSFPAKELRINNTWHCESERTAVAHWSRPIKLDLKCRLTPRDDAEVGEGPRLETIECDDLTFEYNTKSH